MATPLFNTSRCNLPEIPAPAFPLPSCPILPAPPPILDAPRIAIPIDPPNASGIPGPPGPPGAPGQDGLDGCTPTIWSSPGDFTVTMLAPGATPTIVIHLYPNRPNPFGPPSGPCDIEFAMALGIPYPAGVNVTIPVAWRYNNTTHKFENKTQTLTVLAAGAVSDWDTVPDGDQPIVLQDLLHSVTYDATAHQFLYTYIPSIWALDTGMIQGPSLIVQLVPGCP